MSSKVSRSLERVSSSIFLRIRDPAHSQASRFEHSLHRGLEQISKCEIAAAQVDDDQAHRRGGESMVGKTVAKSVMTGAVIFLLSGLGLSQQSSEKERLASPPPAQVAPQAASSGGRDGCAASTSSPTKPAEARATAWTCLREGLSNKDSDHSVQAVYALGTLGVQGDTIPLIEARLQDTDSFVRQAAAKTLGDMQAHESAPRLHAALDDKSAAVSFTAAQALWRMGDQTRPSTLAQKVAR